LRAGVLGNPRQGGEDGAGERTGKEKKMTGEGGWSSPGGQARRQRESLLPTTDYFAAYAAGGGEKAPRRAPKNKKVWKVKGGGKLCQGR